MAENSLYPGFVDLFYQSNGHQHKARIPCSPYVGLDGVYGLETGTPGPGYFPWTAGVDAYVTVFRGVLPATAQVIRAELWTLASPTSDPIFRSVHEVELAGTAGGSSVANAQAVWTFRSDVGGIVRIYAMEAALSVNNEYFPPLWGASNIKAVADYVLSAPSWVKARDGGKPLAGVRFLSKTNDTLRKKYLLDS